MFIKVVSAFFVKKKKTAEIQIHILSLPIVWNRAFQNIVQNTELAKTNESTNRNIPEIFDARIFDAGTFGMSHIAQKKRRTYISLLS